MKKIFKYSLSMMAVLCVQSIALANAPAFTNDAGIYNQMQQKQLEQKYVEQKLIAPVERVELQQEDVQKMEIEVQKDVEKDGVIYNPNFKLNKIVFEGNTKIKTKTLDKLCEDIVGKNVYFEDLLNLTLKITKYYQSKGYITSYACVPEQDIVNGVATISIVESTVRNIDISGNKWARSWYLKHIVMGRDGLREGTVFNAKALQASLRELNEENYIQASTTVSRNNDETSLELKVRDRFPLKFNFGWDDYGRKYTGEQRASFLLGLSNLTGLGDKIYGGTALSSGSTGVMAGYSIPVSPYGTRLALDYGFSNVSLGGPYRGLKVKGKAQTMGVKLIHPLIRNAKTDLVAFSGVDFVSADTKSERFDLMLSDYSLIVLRNGIRGITDDRYGRWIGQLGADIGLSGSDKLGSAAERHFVKVTAGATRVQRIWKKLIGIVRVNGQYSPNRLYALEQMQLGGPFTLRGYQPAELIGDYGVNGTIEFRSPIPGFRYILPRRFKSIDDRVRLAVFYDWGWIKEHDNLYNYPQNFLQSVGFGSYFDLTDTLTLQLGVGFPIGYKYYGESTGRFYFSVNMELDKLIPHRKPERL